MDLVSGYKGMVGLVFGNDNSGSNEDSYVERLLDRISNGVLPDDRRNAMAELQSVVAESRGAQLAFGAMGFPVLMGVLKEERDDVEMIRGALETLVSALTPIDHAKGAQNEVQPALMNTDLLSREAENISLLLSLLSEEDFYVRYYTLQILTALLTNSQNRLQEAILTIPRGITRLMDMLMDREVIRNEALLLLTHLTREAEEIQKILVFEGAFEKIFSIIKEEGGSEGGVVVQDCLELLNNLLRNNASNQVLLRETLGFDAIISILKLRGSAYTKSCRKKEIRRCTIPHRQSPVTSPATHRQSPTHHHPGHHNVNLLPLVAILLLLQARMHHHPVHHTVNLLLQARVHHHLIITVLSRSYI